MSGSATRMHLVAAAAASKTSDNRAAPEGTAGPMPEVGGEYCRLLAYLQKARESLRAGPWQPAAKDRAWVRALLVAIGSQPTITVKLFGMHIRDYDSIAAQKTGGQVRAHAPIPQNQSTSLLPSSNQKLPVDARMASVLGGGTPVFDTLCRWLIEHFHRPPPPIEENNRFYLILSFLTRAFSDDRSMRIAPVSQFLYEMLLHFTQVTGLEKPEITAPVLMAAFPD